MGSEFVAPSCPSDLNENREHTGEDRRHVHVPFCFFLSSSLPTGQHWGILLDQQIPRKGEGFTHSHGVHQVPSSQFWNSPQKLCREGICSRASTSTLQGAYSTCLQSIPLRKSKFQQILPLLQFSELVFLPKELPTTAHQSVAVLALLALRVGIRGRSLQGPQFWMIPPTQLWTLFPSICVLLKRTHTQWGFR